MCCVAGIFLIWVGKINHPLIASIWAACCLFSTFFVAGAAGMWANGILVFSIYKAEFAFEVIGVFLFDIGIILALFWSSETVSGAA